LRALRFTAFVGARPNLPKAWTLQHALGGLAGRVDYRTVHTGQHFTAALSSEMAIELGVNIDEYYATPMSESDACQLGSLMRCVETELEASPPDCVIAMGDVNSTLATALVAARMGIPIIHLEAGLRSNDGCPEEVNRRVISTLTTCHLCPTERAVSNLVRAGTPSERIHFVGNAMIECLLAKQPQIRNAFRPQRHQVTPRQYAVMTAHKPLTLSDPETLVRMCAEVGDFVSTVVFPCHPHTHDVLRRRHLLRALPSNVAVLPPSGYLAFAALVANARVVVTDSDGVQEECCATSTPCCIMTDHTARPECVEAGASILVGVSPSRLRSGLRLLDDAGARTIPDRWDTLVSERIRRAVLSFSESLGEPRRLRLGPPRYEGHPKAPPAVTARPAMPHHGAT
jgi:UDP-N-acetylglucosamine 2-epimerase (non-hydrolysing)